MKLLRRIAIGIAGGVVLLIGIAMIVLPGPAIVVIPAGLAILAIEFVWARKVLHQLREFIAARKAQFSSPKTSPAEKTTPRPDSLPSTR